MLAAIGNALLMRSGIDSCTPSMLVLALDQVLSAALRVGAVWLGIVLAYRATVGARG